MRAVSTYYARIYGPRTEKVAVSQAFSHIVQVARSASVVLDIAPTGQSLLLMEATGGYHRQIARQMDSTAMRRDRRHRCFRRQAHRL